MKKLFSQDRSLPTPNIIGTTSLVNGDVSCDIDFRIDGELNGDINIGGCLIVGPTGKVSGTITADSVEVAGTINATIKANDYILMKSTANLSGDLTTSKIIIETGATFNGKCEMIETKETKKK